MGGGGRGNREARGRRGFPWLLMKRLPLPRYPSAYLPHSPLLISCFSDALGPMIRDLLVHFQLITAHNSISFPMLVRDLS